MTLVYCVVVVAVGVPAVPVVAVVAVVLVVDGCPSKDFTVLLRVLFFVTSMQSAIAFRDCKKTSDRFSALSEIQQGLESGKDVLLLVSCRLRRCVERGNSHLSQGFPQRLP